MRDHKFLISLGLLFLGASILFPGCTADTPTASKIPFTDQQSQTLRIVSIGNSLTAGFMNGGLISAGQAAGFPNVLQKQIRPSSPPVINPADVEGNFFYLQTPVIGLSGISSSTTDQGAPQGTLYVNSSGAITQDPFNPADITSRLLNATYPLPYDNLGVPGATTTDITTATTSANSQSVGNLFFNLILRNEDLAGEIILPPGTTTQIVQYTTLATRQTIVGVDEDTGSPITGTFLPNVATVWIGNNDILGGATNGDPVVGVNITPASVFESLLLPILDSIQALKIPMVAIANVPVVTSIPFFTTVPLVEPTSGLAWATDETDVEFILLTAKTKMEPPLGPDYLEGIGTLSIPSTFTLTTTEVIEVEKATTDYNVIIAREALDRGWASVDAALELANLPGDPTDPQTYQELNAVFPWLDFIAQDGTAEQNVNSGFSLDGIHPSEKGYQLITNLFAEALNDAYGMSFTDDVDPLSIPNNVGFENAPAPPKTGPIGAYGLPEFTRNGARGISGTVRMLGGDR